MRVRTLLRLTGGLLLISSLTACGGGGAAGTANTPSSTSSSSTGGTGGSTPTYIIGGSLNGLTSGTGVSVVLKNGSDTLALTQNGSFSFPTAAADGTAYDVSVSAQPPFPQRCTIANGSGTVTGASVTTISATCSPSITEATLYNFQGAPLGVNDGGTPRTVVIFDKEGNLYGTTSRGGTNNDGTVYELTPDGKGGYTEKVLYDFGSGSADGVTPSGVIFDSQGNLYGTTYTGGSADEGTVFELEPDGSGGYTEKVLYSFSDATGGTYPAAGLTIDGAGNLYGTTKDPSGNVFELKPNGAGGYTLSVLFDFSTAPYGNGATPMAALTLDSQGNLYGTTENGGVGGGTVFELKPNGSGGYTESVLYRFLGGSDGLAPDAPVTLDSQGDLYGTTTAGGNAGNGTVFELEPNGSGGYTESVLYRFAGISSGVIDGSAPYGAVLIDSQGNLFGTTTWGGNTDDGTVFELVPNGSGGYTESMLYSFTANVGPGPYAGLTSDNQGNLYGTTGNGGTYDYGDVFEIE